MKKLAWSVLFFVFTFFGLNAQTPETFSYQAVVRDSNGDIVVTQPVSFQISIISGTALGTVEYVETHSVTTNAFGLVTMPVGTGTVISGDFTLIDWGTNLYFIKVEVDITGGTTYTDMGTVQLLSVPYALYARSAGNTFSGNYNDLSNLPDFTGWDQDSTDDFNGDYNNLSNLPDFTGWDQDEGNDFSGNYNDLSNKPLLLGDVNGDIENNTVEKIQGMNVSGTIPADGQILKWNNTLQIWEPSEDQLGAAGTTDGVVTGATFTGTSTKTLTLIRSNGLGDIIAVFTDNVDDADSDPSNELQALSITGSNLSISGGNTVSLPVNNYTAGGGIDIQSNQIINTQPDQEVILYNSTGIAITGSYPIYTVINTLPDQPVTLTGSGSTTITGTYPDYTITSTDNNTEYTPGTGIDIQSNQIINLAPDQPVALTGTGATTVTGTYPNFTITSTDNVNDADADPANEIQSLSLSGNDLTITGGNTVTLPQNVYTAGSGITISGNVVSNPFPDQPVTMSNGTGISVTGTYPDFTITNMYPDQNVALTGAGATTISGTYPNFTITSTDDNTTYTAGTGLTLTGTQFTHNAHGGDVSGTTDLTVTGIQGRVVSTNIPANGQVLKWNSTSLKWEPNDDALGAAGTNDGVVTSASVTGTTTKTLTLTRSESLGDIIATFTDEGSVYTAGTGINITGTTVTNTAPDQAVSITGIGATTVTGTYPSFTVSSTDNNTTYTAGTGLALTGTQFSNTQTLAQSLTNGNSAGTSNIDMNSQDITNVDVLRLRANNAAYLDLYWGHILDYNNSHGVEGQVLRVHGTSPTTYVTWDNPSALFSAGTGISISGSTITNTAPDQSISISGSGATTVTGTYPSFTISSTNSGGTVTSIATGNGITGGTITTTGTLGLTGQALALHNLSTSGIIARTGSGTVAARTITSGNGILVTNGDGISGNPTIAANFGTTSTTVAAGNHTHTTYGAAGTNGMVQFNNSGAFGGVQGFLWDNTNSRLMINGATTTGQQSNLVVRQTTNPVNTTRDSVILANLGLDIRQNATSVNYYGSGLKFTIGDASTYTGTAAIFAERTGSWSSGDLHFAVNESGVSGKTTLPIRMTIKNTGKVGIGTTNPTAQLEVKSLFTAPSAEPLFEIKNKAGQTIFVVYEDSVRIYVDDDPAKSNKGAFAVSGRNTAKAYTHDFFKVTPDFSRVYTGDPVLGFGVENINGTSDESYMRLTPENYFIGHKSGTSITNGKYNTFFGYYTGYAVTGGAEVSPGEWEGSNNILIGYESGKNLNKGLNNIYIGYMTGHVDTGGVYNTFIGFQAGMSTTGTHASSDGSYNTFIGCKAGANNIIGAHNVFMGNIAGWNNTTGTHNVFIGSNSGLINNTGTGNTFLGAHSGRNNTTGINNVCIGRQSGYNVSTGSNNVFIGYQAGYGLNTNDRLFIENSNNVTNPLVHGDFVNDRIAFHRTATTYPVQVGTTTSNGNGAFLTAGGVWTAGSSRSFKDRYTDVKGSDVLSKISNMELKGWYYKETEEYHIGPFAEDFYQAFGCGDQKVKEDLGRYLAPSDVAGVTMIAVKELIQIINKQQSEIDELKREVEDLKSK